MRVVVLVSERAVAEVVHSIKGSREVGRHCDSSSRPTPAKQLGGGGILF